MCRSVCAVAHYSNNKLSTKLRLVKTRCYTYDRSFVNIVIARNREEEKRKEVPSIRDRATHSDIVTKNTSCSTAFECMWLSVERKEKQKRMYD